jgi:hypothetical protein
VTAQILVKQEILQRVAEPAVVGNALVEFKIRIDDLLDDRLDLVIKVRRTFSRVLTRAAASRAGSASNRYPLCLRQLFHYRE